MFLLNNIRRRNPTYIVSCDIKSAYDNVDQEGLFNHMKKEIIPKIRQRGDRQPTKDYR